MDNNITANCICICPSGFSYLRTLFNASHSILPYLVEMQNAKKKTKNIFYSWIPINAQVKTVTPLVEFKACLKTKSPKKLFFRLTIKTVWLQFLANTYKSITYKGILNSIFTWIFCYYLYQIGTLFPNLWIEWIQFPWECISRIHFL